MELQGEFAVGRFDLSLTGASLETQGAVVVPREAYPRSRRGGRS